MLMLRPSREDRMFHVLTFRSVAVLAILSSSVAFAQAAKELPPLNAKILEYAKDHIGEMVGDGECTSLALEAMKASGAKRFRMIRDGDYVWGEPVASFKDARPGDIVQFRDAVFEGRSRPNNRGVTTFWRYEFSHHTAIIAKVQERGQRVAFLHQNIGGVGIGEEAKRKVKQQLVRVDSLQPGGKVWIYRPLPIAESDKNDPEIPFDSTSRLKFRGGDPG